MKPLTVALVNRSLLDKYGLDEKGERKVRMYAGRGYYYFTGSLGFRINSYYIYRIADAKLADVLSHVAFGVAAL